MPVFCRLEARKDDAVFRNKMDQVVIVTVVWFAIGGAALGQQQLIYPPPPPSADARLTFADGSSIDVVRLTFGREHEPRQRVSSHPTGESNRRRLLLKSTFDPSANLTDQILLESPGGLMLSNSLIAQHAYVPLDLARVRRIRTRQGASATWSATVTTEAGTYSGRLPLSCVASGTKRLLGQSAPFSTYFPFQVREIIQEELASIVTDFHGESSAVHGLKIVCEQEVTRPESKPFQAKVRFGSPGTYTDVKVGEIARIEFAEEAGGRCISSYHENARLAASVTMRDGSSAVGTVDLPPALSAFTLEGHVLAIGLQYPGGSPSSAYSERSCLPALKRIDFSREPWSLARFADTDASLVVRGAAAVRALSMQEKAYRLRFVVTESGRIGRVLNQDLPDAEYAQMIDALRQHVRFRPASLRGNPVSVSLEFPLGVLAGQSSMENDNR